jgi:hypothetical protein
MIFAALLGCGVGLLALGSSTPNEGAIEVFRTTSPDGHAITVNRSEHVEHVVPTEERLAQLPEGSVAFEGDVRVFDYVALVRHSAGDETVIWRTSRMDMSLGDTLGPELVVFDVALGADRAAILYSDLDAGKVDLVERGADGQYLPTSTETLIAESSAFGGMWAGKLMWLDGLYALVDTTSADEEIWFVGNGGAERVYRRGGVSLPHPPD